RDRLIGLAERCGRRSTLEGSFAPQAPTAESWPMPYEAISLDIADAVATITLNRPERMNAFTDQMARELVRAFDETDANDDVRVVIVTGAGRAFCAGADLGAGGATFDYEKRLAARGET